MEIRVAAAAPPIAKGAKLLPDEGVNCSGSVFTPVSWAIPPTEPEQVPAACPCPVTCNGLLPLGRVPQPQFFST